MHTVVLGGETLMKLQTEELDRQYISSEVRFYTIDQLRAMLGWSEATVQKLFNDPQFPSSDYGKAKVVEVHALINFFSRKHIKGRECHWR